METIKEKYRRLRPLLQDGDTILVKNKKGIGVLISFCDKAYWTHVLSCQWTVISGESRLLSLEAGLEGVDVGFLSSHLRMYSDFVVLRPLRSRFIIADVLCDMIYKAECGVDYNYGGGLAGLIERFFKHYLKINLQLNWGNKDQVICSTWEQTKVFLMGIEDYKDVKRMFPQDFIRYLQEKNFQIIN